MIGPCSLEDKAEKSESKYASKVNNTWTLAFHISNP